MNLLFIYPRHAMCGFYINTARIIAIVPSRDIAGVYGLTYDRGDRMLDYYEIEKDDALKIINALRLY